MGVLDERASDDVLRVNERVRIPLSDLAFSAVRSAGPGGQHVNKTETAIELAFDVAGSPYLTDEDKSRIRRRLTGYVDSAGVLHLTAQSERSQSRNRVAVIARFVQLLRAGLVIPKTRTPTKPSRGAVARRLDQKRRAGAVKRLRRPADDA